jgi:glycosyltransferase involved in cell wall biosynthesis
MSHVAQLIPTLDRIGGAERQVLLLAKGLCARGWRVTVIALTGSVGDAARELSAAGATFLSLGMRKGLVDPRGWVRMNRWIRSERPDVLHAHLPHAAWMARWSRLAAPVRVAIDTIHTSATGTTGRRVGYRWSRWLPDRVTAVGEAVRDAYLGAGMVTAGQCVVVPNGVDAAAWRPDAETRALLRGEVGHENDFWWLAAGRLEAVKDYATMLRALAQTPEQARLFIAGSGPLEGELRTLAGSLGIEGRVHFLGFVAEVRRWMQAADGFLLSSRWEGLPTAPIEAAMCELPAVATDVAGTREVLVDGVTGWLCAAGSAAEMAEQMRRTMAMTADEGRAMGARARKRAVERFSLEKVLDRWESLYRELLERNPRPRRWADG